MSTSNPQNKDVITNEPGSHPVGTGVGTIGGALAGAAAGAVAGPAGIIIGAIAGGVAGGLAGHHVGEGVNPSLGVVPDDEHAVGTGVGATTGAIAGGLAGSVIAGPFGTAAGAAIGASIGAYAGNETEEALDKHSVDLHDQRNNQFAERVSKAPIKNVTPRGNDEMLVNNVNYTEKPFVPDTLNDRPLDERDYKKTEL